jgi:TPR repeat protein
LHRHGLPTVARGTAWSPAQVARLGLLYENGTLTGAPAYGEARRLYCLALRRDGYVGAGVLLSDLYAGGLGGTRSARLAAHFARVGALAYAGEVEFQGDRLPFFLRSDLTGDRASRNAAAEGWLAAPGPRDATGLARLAERYRAGEGVLRSDLLANFLLHQASETDKRFVIPYVRQVLESHREWVVEDERPAGLLVSKVLSVLTDPEVPEAQAFYGSLFFEGVLVERNVMAGAMWICAGYQYSAPMGAPWCAWLRTRTPAERRKATEGFKWYELPNLIGDLRR